MTECRRQGPRTCGVSDVHPNMAGRIAYERSSAEGHSRSVVPCIHHDPPGKNNDKSQGDFGTKVGGQMIIKDWQDHPRVLIETTELTCRPFNEIDESFARDEGEGDLSLEYWRREHQKYFIREGTFSEDMKVYCQRFKVIEILKI